VNQPEEDLSSRVALDLRQGGVPRGSVAMCALWAFLGDRDSDQSIEILDRMGFEDAPLTVRRNVRSAEPDHSAPVRTSVRLGKLDAFLHAAVGRHLYGQP
jgi:hypothetical protein